MYIEFSVTDNRIKVIRQELKAWSDVNEVSYTEVIAKDKLRVTLPQDGDYTRFVLTWRKEPQWLIPHLIHE